MSLFSSLFQQAKDIVSPNVQMGQPIRKNSDVKEKQKVDDTEMTEDGFVCVGRSSFYQSENHSGTYNPQSVSGYTPSPYPPQNNAYPNLNQQNPVYPQQFGSGNSQYEVRESYDDRNGQRLPSMGIGDFVQNVPFVLHPDLRPYVPMYKSNLNSYSSRRNIDWSQFDYDFNFERHVILEMNQQSANSKMSNKKGNSGTMGLNHIQRGSGWETFE